MGTVTNRFDARKFLQKNRVFDKRRVCAFTRVSTQHEQQTNALVNQNQWIVDEISRHPDWVFDIDKDLYIDEGISGTSMKRRVNFNTMLEKAKNGEYDLIVTREVCRFMRNAKLTLLLVDELEQCGVEVYFVNDGIWSFNKDDYFKLTIMATYAEQESRKDSQRVFTGQASARQKGRHFGNGNILGYDIKKGKTSEETTYIINEEQAKTVRLIYDLIIQGLGMKKIKNYLEDNGYKTSSGNTKWHLSSIERILRRRTYMGEYEYLQSVTVDPLTHERVSQLDKDMRVRAKGNYPPIIEPETWFLVQDIIDSRINHDVNVEKTVNDKSELVMNGSTPERKKHIMRGKVVNKDIFCQKMRCGCGRRFKKDNCRRDNTATYRCYQVVDDGSQQKRAERSAILNDDCCVDGIIDWKLELFTKKVFEFLEYNTSYIQDRILSIIEKVYIPDAMENNSEMDKITIEANIKELCKKKERLLDALADGLISKEDYKNRADLIEQEIEDKKLKLKQVEKCESDAKTKEATLLLVKEFVKNSLSFGGDGEVFVPEVFIETYVNSIKACANNVFEFNIKINPDAVVDSPLVVPDDEFIPSVHSASKILNNANCILLKEIYVDYGMAKEYANKLKRRIKRVHWQTPATIKIYVSI